MNLGLKDSVKLARAVIKIKNNHKKNKIVLCPSFTSLERVGSLIKRTPLELGAQDMFWEERGAFTGEISPAMLKEAGVKYVILGHSERRNYLKETDKIVGLKTRAALKNGLIPIVCIGETAEERRAGNYWRVLSGQIAEIFRDLKLSPGVRIFVAYEPIWAIGTGKFLDAAAAAEAHLFIRKKISEIFSSTVARSNFTIIYGGSVDSKSILGFTKEQEIQGVLVGGAAQKLASFKELIKKSQCL